MYYEHFGLNAPPFRITPETQLFYSGGRRGLVLDALVYAISQGEGIVKVVGEVGSGKTMLCRMLAEKLPDTVEVIYLANPRLTPDTILQAIALEMGLAVANQTPPPDRLHVMQALHNALLEKHARGRQVVALIEEAQSMPLETLEEIRLLSNLETTRHKLLQMVLFGQPELDENLSAEHIRQLKERITHSFELAPLNREETAEYVDFRLRAVGYKGPPLFSDSALKLLVKSSQGLLRRANILADKALLAVFSDGQHLVKTTHMRQAVDDSGFLDYSGKYRKQRLAWLGATVLTVTATLGAGLGWWNASEPESPLPATVALQISRPASAPPVVPAAAEAPLAGPETIMAAAAPTAIAAPLLPPLQARLRATLEWLAQAETQHYTLQVMELDSDEAEAVERFIETEALDSVLSTLYIFRFPRRDTTRWLLLYGDFPDRASAQAAIAGLPAALKRNQPFARTVGSLQAKLGD